MGRHTRTIARFADDTPHAADPTPHPVGLVHSPRTPRTRSAPRPKGAGFANSARCLARSETSKPSRSSSANFLLMYARHVSYAAAHKDELLNDNDRPTVDDQAERHRPVGTELGLVSNRDGASPL